MIGKSSVLAFVLAVSAMGAALPAADADIEPRYDSYAEYLEEIELLARSYNEVPPVDLPFIALTMGMDEARSVFNGSAKNPLFQEALIDAYVRKQGFEGLCAYVSEAFDKRKIAKDAAAPYMDKMAAEAAAAGDMKNAFAIAEGGMATDKAMGICLAAMVGAGKRAEAMKKLGELPPASRNSDVIIPLIEALGKAGAKKEMETALGCLEDDWDREWGKITYVSGLLAAGKITEAAAAAKLTSKPDFALAAAEAYLKAGKKAEATALLDKTMVDMVEGLHPMEVGYATLRIGVVYLKAGRADKAWACFDGGIEDSTWVIGRAIALYAPFADAKAMKRLSDMAYQGVKDDIAAAAAGDWAPVEDLPNAFGALAARYAATGAAAELGALLAFTKDCAYKEVKDAYPSTIRSVMGAYSDAGKDAQALALAFAQEKPDEFRLPYAKNLLEKKRFDRALAAVAAMDPTADKARLCGDIALAFKKAKDEKMAAQAISAGFTAAKNAKYKDIYAATFAIAVRAALSGVPADKTALEVMEELLIGEGEDDDYDDPLLDYL
jgi:hypothetical protein